MNNYHVLRFLVPYFLNKFHSKSFHGPMLNAISVPSTSQVYSFQVVITEAKILNIMHHPNEK
jgi:hypothetical protein